jgi:hypothetical protein
MGISLLGWSISEPGLSKLPWFSPLVLARASSGENTIGENLFGSSELQYA